MFLYGNYSRIQDHKGLLKATKCGIIDHNSKFKISFEIDAVNVNSGYYGLDQWRLGPLDCWTFLYTFSLSFF